MKRSKLPLTALRAFEAAGRHESFKHAAAELAVTEAAISRQVRDLERLLGLPLFTRDHRAVHLTDKGHDLLARLSAGFDAIDAAVTAVTGREPQSIAVSVEPTFAHLFLVPKLGDFSQLHPELDVSIEANSALADLREPDGPSLAIRFSLSRSAWPGVESKLLMEDWLTPMVAAQHSASVLEPSDLLRHRLLKDESGNAWTEWLARAGVEAPPDWGPTFSNAASSVQGAEFGQGAVLGNRLLCSHLLASGRLVAPFDLAIPNGAYWVVARDLSRISAAEAVFVDWLYRLVDASPATSHGIETARPSPISAA